MSHPPKIVVVMLTLTDGSLVHKIVIPKFLQVPRVLVWGNRVFQHAGNAHPADGADLKYCEVFAWWVPS